MLAKKIFLLGISVLAVVCCADAQTLRFTGAGLVRGSLEATNKRQNTILTTGGFVNIRSDDVLGAFHYRTFFKGKRDTSTWMPPGQIYLKVNDEYEIEMFGPNTRVALKVFSIKRIKAVPALRFIRQSEHNSPLLPSSKYLILSAKEKLRAIVNGKPDFNPATIEYTFTNLKTGRVEHSTSASGIGPFSLEPGSVYQLRFNYQVQPESFGSLLIKTEPRWYKSPLSYLTLIFFVTALIVIVISKFYKRRVRALGIRQQEMEQAALRLQTQLNPHFTFNALNTIQGLMNTNRLAEANDYLHDFSSLLRTTLTKSGHVYNSLDQELSMMRTYIRLESLRFKFTWDIELTDNIDTFAVEIPTLLIQPVIENAIRHGLSGLGEQGRLLIKCEQQQNSNNLIIKIEDNGTWSERKDGTGFGLSLTTQRLTLINHLQQGRHITMHFNKQSGTQAVFIFHNWLS